MELYELSNRLDTLALFDGLYHYTFVCSLIDYINSPTRRTYAMLASDVIAAGKPLGELLLDALLTTENPYVHTRARGNEPSQGMLEALELELETLQAAADLSARDLLELLDEDDMFALPTIDTCSVALAQSYREKTANLSRWGYGIYAKYRAFVLNEDGDIVPVKYPDETRLAELVGYEREKTIIIDNTRALLARRPAANILLTGDAGTGKSSTVKAVVNELADEGLRIVELRKSQLHMLPSLLDELNRNPLAFILFIDDLSFQANDDDYAALKAVLEGSVAAKSANVVVYATSNRRHLVRERFSDREGDDVHLSETLQELSSLSERFGIRVSFAKPDKVTYLSIVHALAEQYGVECENIEDEAERFALRSGGRSARRARQFVDGLRAKG